MNQKTLLCKIPDQHEVITSAQMSKWVRLLRNRSGENISWSYEDGSYLVYGDGDDPSLLRILEAIDASTHLLETNAAKQEGIVFETFGRSLGLRSQE